MSVETLPPQASPQDPAAIGARLEAQWAAQYGTSPVETPQDALTSQEAALIGAQLENEWAIQHGYTPAEAQTSSTAGETPSDMALIGGQLEAQHAAQNLYSPLEAPAFDVTSTEFTPWYPESSAAPAVQTAEAPAPSPLFTTAAERAGTPSSHDDRPANGEYLFAPDAAIIPDFVTAEGSPIEPTSPTPAPTERGTVYGTRRDPAAESVPTEAPVEAENPMAAFTVGAGMPKTEADILREQGKPVPARVQAQSAEIKKAYATLERELKEAGYVGVNNGEVVRGEMATALIETDGPAAKREKFRHRAPHRTIGNVALSAVASVRGAVSRKLAERRAENDVIFNMEEPEEVVVPAEAQVTRHRRTRKSKSGARRR